MKKIGNSQKVPMYALFFVLGLIFGVLLSNFIGAGMAKRAVINDSNEKLNYIVALHTNQEYLEIYTDILKSSDARSAIDAENEIINQLKKEGITPDKIDTHFQRGICSWFCGWVGQNSLIGRLCKCKATEDNTTEEAEE